MRTIDINPLPFIIIIGVLASLIFPHFQDDKNTSDLKEIAIETGLELPESSEILFTYKQLGIKGGVFLIKARMNKNDWNSFIQQPLFKGKSMEVNKDRYLTFDWKIEGWNPQDVKLSTSGKVRTTEHVTVEYLFDLSNEVFVDAYFEAFID